MNKPLRTSSWRAWLLLFFALAVASSPASADWRKFRGNASRGEAEGRSPPTEWEEDDEAKSAIAWRVDLPGRGVSSPIVVASKVVVTASSGFKQDRLHVLCFDAASGKQAWHRQFWATGRTLCHPTMAVAAGTPASDGTRIVAQFSSNDLVCLDLNGNLLWLRGLGYDHPTAANDVGMASSPLIVGQTVVVQIENKGESFAAGIDLETGLSRWRHDREQAMNWTSPALWESDGNEPLVLLQSPHLISAHRPGDGHLVWSHKTGCSVIPSVVSDGDLVYLPAGGLTALRPSGESVAPEVVWQEGKLAPESASPVVADGRVYTINSAPALSCADTATGKIIWRLRLAGPFWATPALAGGHLYCVSDKGLAQVVRLADEGKVVSRYDFAEAILASPAVSDGAVYFRSDAHLWKVAWSDRAP